MDIIQSYYTLSNKNNGAELIFWFNIGLSRMFLLEIKESLLIFLENRSLPFFKYSNYLLLSTKKKKRKKEKKEKNNDPFLRKVPN